jgi:hypothetical protein
MSSNPHDALKAADNCNSVPTRTMQIGIQNGNPNWGIEIAFFQLIADDEAVFPPYIKDTGVFSPCHNVPPATNCIADPCRAQMNPGNPIQGRYAKMSVKFRSTTGQTQDDQQEAVAPEHRHWINAIWGYKVVKDSAGNEKPQLEMRGEHAPDEKKSNKK